MQEYINLPLHSKGINTNNINNNNNNKNINNNYNNNIIAIVGDAKLNIKTYKAQDKYQETLRKPSKPTAMGGEGKTNKQGVSSPRNPRLETKETIIGAIRKNDATNETHQNDRLQRRDKPLTSCFEGGSIPEKKLRIASVNIMKQNVFRHHAIIRMCQEYKPHVIMLVEIGFNDRNLQGYSRINSPITHRGGVAIYINHTLNMVKNDNMDDICSAIVRTDKYSLIALIALYINPARSDKENVIHRLMNYTDFLGI